MRSNALAGKHRSEDHFLILVPKSRFMYELEGKIEGLNLIVLQPLFVAKRSFGGINGVSQIISTLGEWRMFELKKAI